jgi:putative ABC transport system ATP-binding protein
VTPVVRLIGVRKRYSEGGAEKVVLAGVDAELAAGALVAIRGPSGSGKSTLLNLIAGIDVPSAGSVEVEGERLDSLTPRELALLRRDRIGLVFQFFNLIPTLTVLENVTLPAELTRSPGARERALELLGEVGLAARADSFPDRLSGGEQQRVGIARALIRNPRLVLADEPTGNLDADTGHSVMQLLDRLTRGAGRSLVLVTHSPAVSALADRVLRLDHGRLLEDSPSPAPPGDVH